MKTTAGICKPEKKTDSKQRVGEIRVAFDPEAGPRRKGCPKDQNQR
jgi:hypothetical protein